MKTWFTSDLHFGHKNIIKYCARPFASASEMDEALIENWNSAVAPGDTVWNLGDVAFCCSDEYALQCLQRLNGYHHFVRGNHDAIGQRLPVGEWHGDLAEIEVEGQRIVLCHYPMRTWHHAQRGVWHLFGHVHGLLRPFGKSADVGVDNTWEILRHAYAPEDAPPLPASPVQIYRPVSFEEIKEFMDARSIGDHEKFQNFEVKLS